MWLAEADLEREVDAGCIAPVIPQGISRIVRQEEPTPYLHPTPNLTLPDQNRLTCDTLQSLRRRGVANLEREVDAGRCVSSVIPQRVPPASSDRENHPYTLHPTYTLPASYIHPTHTLSKPYLHPTHTLHTPYLQPTYTLHPTPYLTLPDQNRQTCNMLRSLRRRGWADLEREVDAGVSPVIPERISRVV